jgi:hypothetical protein
MRYEVIDLFIPGLASLIKKYDFYPQLKIRFDTPLFSMLQLPNDLLVGHNSEEIVFYDLKDGKCIKKINYPPSYIKDMQYYVNNAQELILVLLDEQGKLLFIDTVTYTFKTFNIQGLVVTCFRIHNDKLFIGTRYNVIYVWDINLGETIASYNTVYLNSKNYEAMCIKFINNETFIVGCQDIINFWKIDESKPFYQINTYSNNDNMCILPDGKVTCRYIGIHLMVIDWQKKEYKRTSDYRGDFLSEIIQWRNKVVCLFCNRNKLFNRQIDVYDLITEEWVTYIQINDALYSNVLFKISHGILIRLESKTLIFEEDEINEVKIGIIKSKVLVLNDNQLVMNLNGHCGIYN